MSSFRYEVDRILVVALLLGITTAAAGQDVAAPPQARKSFELFDGTTLDGWVVLGGFATYAVEDNAIVGTSGSATTSER